MLEKKVELITQEKIVLIKTGKAPEDKEDDKRTSWKFRFEIDAYSNKILKRICYVMPFGKSEEKPVNFPVVHVSDSRRVRFDSQIQELDEKFKKGFIGKEQYEQMLRTIYNSCIEDRYIGRDGVLIAFVPEINGRERRLRIKYFEPVTYRHGEEIGAYNLRQSANNRK